MHRDITNRTSKTGKIILLSYLLIFCFALLNAQQTITVKTNNDTYSYQNDPNRVNGDSYRLVIKNNPPRGYSRRIFVGFDISSAPSSSQIESVKLYMYNFDNDEYELPVEGDFRRITGSWDESSLTWNNSPAVTNTNMYEYTMPNSIGWANFDITNLYKDAKNIGAEFSIRIDDPTPSASYNERMYSYYSKEQSSYYAPYLKITYTQAPAFSFVHITDLHVTTSESIGDEDLNGLAFKQLRDKINSWSDKPAFVIATGDISHAGGYGSDGQYSALTQYLYPADQNSPYYGDYCIDAAETIPIYFTPGNHDFRLFSGDFIGFDYNLTNYTSNIGPSGNDFFFTHNNALIFLLNSGSDVFTDLTPGLPESVGFTSGTLDWIESILQAHGDMKKIFAFHSPVVNAQGTNGDGTVHLPAPSGTYDGSVFDGNNRFRQICNTYHVDLVLSGHVHQNVVAYDEGNSITKYVQTANAFDGNYRVIRIDEELTVDDAQRLPIVPQEGIIEYPWSENEGGTLKTNINWNYTMGYHFTPQVNGMITNLGGYYYGAKKVKLWNKSTGEELASANVLATNNWQSSEITPVPVQAGVTYTVAAYMSGSGASYRYGLSFPQTFGNIKIEGSTYISGEGRPTNTVTSTMYGQADIGFIKTGSGENLDFESSGGWTITTNPAPEGGCVPTASIHGDGAYGGNYCAKVYNPAGCVTYTNNDRSAYIRQTVTVPTDKPYLNYFLKYDTPYYWGTQARFKMKDRNGTVSYLYSHPAGGYNLPWTKRTHDLSAYAGQTITLEICVEDFGYWAGMGDHVCTMRVDNISFTANADKSISVEVKEPVVTDNYFLSRCYPNPFSSSTTIEYNIPEPEKVNITVYNITGLTVTTLADKNETAGRHSVEWDGTDNGGNRVSAGMYFYKITAGKHSEMNRILLLK